jgi:hypothetical protein
MVTPNEPWISENRSRSTVPVISFTIANPPGYSAPYRSSRRMGPGPGCHAMSTRSRLYRTGPHGENATIIHASIHLTTDERRQGRRENGKEIVTFDSFDGGALNSIGVPVQECCEAVNRRQSTAPHQRTASHHRTGWRTRRCAPPSNTDTPS